MADVHHHRVGPSVAGEEVGHGFNRFLRGGESNAHGAAAIQRVQAFERESKMSAALVIGHGVDFVHDHRVHVTQYPAASLRGEQNVKRLRRGYQDVWRPLQHFLALVRQRIAGAHGRANLRHQQPFFAGQRRDFAQRTFKVFLNVISQRLQRRDIKDLGAVHEIAAQRFAHQPVNADQERRQCLA